MKIFSVILFVPFLLGCAASDSDLKMLNRQQAATIESLNREIARLNRELDEAVSLRRETPKNDQDFKNNVFVK